MTAIRVEVTAEHIQPVDSKIAWADPVEAALERLTGQDVSIDGDGALGNVATIGQNAWTLVVDLPDVANAWLNARWDTNGYISEPFTFELEVPDWILELVDRATAP